MSRVADLYRPKHKIAGRRAPGSQFRSHPAPIADRGIALNQNARAADPNFVIVR